VSASRVVRALLSSRPRAHNLPPDLARSPDPPGVGHVRLESPVSRFAWHRRWHCGRRRRELCRMSAYRVRLPWRMVRLALLLLQLPHGAPRVRLLLSIPRPPCLAGLASALLAHSDFGGSSLPLSASRTCPPSGFVSCAIWRESRRANPCPMPRLACSGRCAARPRPSPVLWFWPVSQGTILQRQRARRLPRWVDGDHAEDLRRP
jgi:hypothetical protein